MRPGESEEQERASANRIIGQRCRRGSGGGGSGAMSWCQTIFYSATHNVQEMTHALTHTRTQKAPGAFVEENFVMMEVMIATVGCLMAAAAAFFQGDSGRFLHQNKKKEQIMNKITHPTSCHPTIMARLLQLFWFLWHSESRKVKCECVWGREVL